MKKPTITARQAFPETCEILRIIDRTEEFADCYLWTGSTTKGGYPSYKSSHGVALARREVFAFAGGVLKPRTPIVMTCGEKLCLNPAHMKASTIAAVGKAAAKNGAWTGLARAAKISATKRAKFAKLTIDDVRVIRASDESGAALAAHFGVDLSLVNGIKRGDRWREYSSPWAGLL